MVDVVVPIVIGCCCVLFAYMLQPKAPSQSGDADSQKKNPQQNQHFFVIFCCGVVLGFIGLYLFGSSSDESINNVMREIHVLEPDF